MAGERLCHGWGTALPLLVNSPAITGGLLSYCRETALPLLVNGSAMAGGWLCHSVFLFADTEMLEQVCLPLVPLLLVPEVGCLLVWREGFVASCHVVCAVGCRWWHDIVIVSEAEISRHSDAACEVDTVIVSRLVDHVLVYIGSRLLSLLVIVVMRSSACLLV